MPEGSGSHSFKPIGLTVEFKASGTDDDNDFDDDRVYRGLLIGFSDPSPKRLSKTLGFSKVISYSAKI